jgi:hypothetical protein
MPAESIRAAHSVLTEISAHPVSKSSLAKDYTIPRPLKRGPVRACAAYSAETGGRNVG